MLFPFPDSTPDQDRFDQRLQRSENFSRRWFSEEQKGPSVLGTDPQETTETSPLPAPTSTSPIIIDPAFSTQNNSDSYLPPSYSPCAVNNIGAGNKIVDNTSEDLLPPYSTCVDALNDADGIPKIHKGESVEKQSCTETDINLNNSHTTDRNNVEQLDSTMKEVIK
ncbi:unnamed protein product [Arctia plantaginis]|uniref:Uncharacterized protein n=1 Tax=Arctia plantaginis TaxID=874455 RepID=A0A8S0Z0H7_ARCPL|nr:unnamed protein product [Arctia plantaginis]